MTADCLPVLLSDARGATVGATHTGWRDLCGDVIERTLDTMMQRLRASGREADPTWLAWLGLAIGPSCFEMGEEMHQAFIDTVRPGELPAMEAAFREDISTGELFASLYTLVRLRLARAGCTGVYNSDLCTMMDTERFYSHRREHITGRMATLI